MPENFDNLFNNEKLVEDFVVYMEKEEIEMTMNKHLEKIHIPNFVKDMFTHDDLEFYFMNPNNPNVIGLLMYIRRDAGDGGESIMEYMNDMVESSIITKKIYKTAIIFKIIELMEVRFESDSET